jgi:hypothetical protein
MTSLPSPYPSLLGKPITHVGLFYRDDASPVPSLALSIATCLAISVRWVRAVVVAIPLSGLRVSRYRRDGAFPGSHRGGNCAHHRRSSCQRRLCRLVGASPHPQASACFEGTGRTKSSTPSTRGVTGGADGLRRIRRKRVSWLTPMRSLCTSRLPAIPPSAVATTCNVRVRRHVR